MKKVSVQLVYECHCPRSRRFIVSQLLPVYELLREYMHLTLLPFGRARIENVRLSSALAEKTKCHGSMVQTCVMRHVEETLTAVRIIACMSRYPDPRHVGRRCVEKHGLEWHLVDQCVTEEGKLLMLDMGKQTWSITSSVNSVPLIRIQGETSHVIQVEAQTNLLSLICARLQNRPPACRGRQNATQAALPGNGTETTEAPSRTTSAAPPSTGC
ncbi:hypothetical protein MTO96_004838 [Rhipicephalus appendiculatus]